MLKPIQWLTAEELRAELERTEPFWQEYMAEVARTQLDSPVPLPHPEMSDEAKRHMEVQQELFRRPAER